jgi:phage-related protein
LEIKVFDQVKKILSKESLEIKEDIEEILSSLSLGIQIALPHVKPLFNICIGLYEIRVKDRSGQFRVVYFIKKNDAIYLIHAYRKKTQEISNKDKNLILNRIKEINNGKIVFIQKHR